MPALLDKVGDLPPTLWLPLADALERAKTLLGPSDDLAAHDLTQHLRAGRLTAGARHLLRNEETCFTFEAAFWQDATIDRPLPGFKQPKVRATALRSGRWYVFIHKAELDRLYPLAAAPDAEGLPTPPGPKPHGDWPTLVAAWLIAVAVENPRRLQNIDALVDDARDFLKEKIRWAPKDTKALRRRISDLLRLISTRR